ncbi:hypothetical protein OG871_33185 [Kitasatospora sp. NBC_00374]|uniref:hypothetical protein n=1 Tax=Kitasatospora sp. NBC_00374 TaxID=2975964 RepID=UPI0030E3D8F6
MAVHLRAEHDLPALRIRLASAGRAGLTRVEFQAVRGLGSPAPAATCQSGDLGLPARLSPTDQLPDEGFRLPDEVLHALGPALDALGPAAGQPQDAVWLELANPRGYLHLVPWEQLLAPLGRPVLRLPQHVLRAQPPSDTLEIAICAGSPPARAGAATTSALLERLTGLWIKHSGHHVHIHLFTDLAGYLEVAEWATCMAPYLVVHDPHDAARFMGPRGTSLTADPGELVNPWLRWIRDALQRRALDVVHFVTDGYLADGRGAIAIAGTPLLGPGQAPSAFVGSAELCTLLAQVGAWCLVVNGAPGNPSGAGLRELADAVAAARPGLVMVDEHDLDEDGRHLAATVTMVVGGGSAVTGAMPGVVCWAHPRFVDSPGTAALLLTKDRRSSLIGGATQDSLVGDGTPAWVAAGTRYLEAQQSAWMPDSPDAAEVDPDAAAALRSVSSLLERHVRRHLDSDHGGAT